MQIQSTFEDRTALLTEIGLLIDARDVVYQLRWNAVEFNSDGFQLLGRIYNYLCDLSAIKCTVIFGALTANAVAVDS